MFETVFALVTVTAMVTLPFLGMPLYILSGVALMKVGKDEGKSKLSLLSWIPIANVLFFTYLSERTADKKVQKGRLTIALAVSALFMINFGGWFIITTVGILLYSFHCIAIRYSNNALAHTLIASATIGISVPVSLFRFRKRQVA